MDLNRGAGGARSIPKTTLRGVPKLTLMVGVREPRRGELHGVRIDQADWDLMFVRQALTGVIFRSGLHNAPVQYAAFDGDNAILGFHLAPKSIQFLPPRFIDSDAECGGFA